MKDHRTKPPMKATDPPRGGSVSIRDKILLAEAFHRRYGETICTAAPLKGLVEDYARAAKQTWRLMEDMKFPGTCGECASRDTGSCCFEGVEEWYDAVLLLINLLLGASLPESREIKGHCFFVGTQGCKLRARDAFCVNFLCPELRARLGQRRVSLFNRTAGDELYRGWKLERAVRRSLLQDKEKTFR